MRKIAAVLLSFILVFSLGACSNDKAGQENPSSGQVSFEPREGADFEGEIEFDENNRANYYYFKETGFIVDCTFSGENPAIEVIRIMSFASAGDDGLSCKNVTINVISGDKIGIFVYLDGQLVDSSANAELGYNDDVKQSVLALAEDEDTWMNEAQLITSEVMNTYKTYLLSPLEEVLNSSSSMVAQQESSANKPDQSYNNESTTDKSVNSSSSSTASKPVSNAKTSRAISSSSSSFGSISTDATTGQKNAVQKTKSYLGFTAFSRDGLIEQLEYEGFTHDQAVYGAEANGY